MNITKEIFIIMNKMLLINETFLELPSQSSDIDYKELYYFKYQKLAYNFLVTLIFYPLFLIMLILFYYYCCRIKHFVDNKWLEIFHMDRYSLMIIVLKKRNSIDIRLYIYLLSVCTVRISIEQYINFVG